MNNKEKRTLDEIIYDIKETILLYWVIFCVGIFSGVGIGIGVNIINKLLDFIF